MKIKLTLSKKSSSFFTDKINGSTLIEVINVEITTVPLP